MHMIHHTEISDTNLREQIRKKEICFGGNENLKIYGTLSCRSGKRMRKENRVFFISEKEALDTGYRPCGPREIPGRHVPARCRAAAGRHRCERKHRSRAA